MVASHVVLVKTLIFNVLNNMGHWSEFTRRKLPFVKLIFLYDGDNLIIFLIWILLVYI